MKKGMFLASFCFYVMVLSAMVNNASAACQISGKVMYTAQSQTGATVYLAPANLPTFYYVFTSTTTTSGGAALIDKINNAQTSGARVTIIGNAASCPTAEVMRSGGVITSVLLW